MGGRELIGIIGLVLVVAGVIGFLIMYRRYQSGVTPSSDGKVKLDAAELTPPSTRAEREAAATEEDQPPGLRGLRGGPRIGGAAAAGRPERPDLLGRSPPPEEPSVDAEEEAIEEPQPEEAPMPEPPPVVEKPRVSLPLPDPPPTTPSRPVSLPRPDSPVVASTPAATPPPSRPAPTEPARAPAVRPQAGSPLARYLATGRRFNPAYPDPVTWGVVRGVMDEAESVYARAARSRATEDLAPVNEELRRLILDGYILGRVEKRTENNSLRFGKASDDPDRDAGRMIEVAVRAAREAWQTGIFTGPIDPEIESIMGEFVDDAAANVPAGARSEDNIEALKVAFSRACSLGRELSLIEASFLDHGASRPLDPIIPSTPERIGREINYATGDDLKIAEKAMRLTRDEFRRPNVSLVRNERST